MVKWVQNITTKDLQKCSRRLGDLSFGVGSNRVSYVYETAGFDIETTQIVTSNYAHAYMYIWSFTINKLTILGTYWDEFFTLLDQIQEVYELDEKRRLLIFIANMSFEFQFMRKLMNITSSFFTDERKPLYVIHNGVFEFRDALQISGGNLATLAKNYTKTQKMVGDLDYSIPRNHNDALKMKRKELQYVINDTVILSEYMEYYFREFSPRGFLPLTKTGILRHQVKAAGKLAAKSNGMVLTNLIAALHPDQKLYSVMMDWLFRGGYVHGPNCYAGLILELLTGADITSSYPAHMLLEDNYPMGKIVKLGDNITLEAYNEALKDNCVMALFEFNDIETTTAHSIESSNKIVLSESAHFDNGRLLDAKKVRVFLSELDFDIYQKFYKWTGTPKILKAWTSKRGRLPNYLLDQVADYYEKKAALKRSGKQGTADYALAKEMVNSGYGLTVTRMRQQQIIYNNVTDQYETDNSFDFNKEVAKQALLPQWGIYVTALARHTLLDMVYQIERQAKQLGRDCDACYMDTDSIKIMNYKDHKATIEAYNEARDKQVREYCSKHGRNYELFKGLGNFDIELPYIKKFRHNGAKRYVMKYYSKGEYVTTSTIAGLPKGKLLEYSKLMQLSVWDLFTNKMCIPAGKSGKLAAIYNDEEHTDVINGQNMSEASSVCLKPIDFTLSIDKDYMQYINEAERRLKRQLL